MNLLHEHGRGALRRLGGLDRPVCGHVDDLLQLVLAELAGAPEKEDEDELDSARCQYVRCGDREQLVTHLSLVIMRKP